jgi:hemerythrin superfamily protein
MAKSKRKTKRAGRATASRGSRQNAIELLKADHREVEKLFAQFEKTRSDERKLQLAQRVCKALKVHTQIEEELFYPAFYEATEEEDIHHEAIVEHNGAKMLIADIEGSSPSDDYYDAKVKVLSEMIKHHVKEEEQPGGMFAEARKSDMDLERLGAQLKARKQELMNGAAAGSSRGRGASAGSEETSARA